MFKCSRMITFTFLLFKGSEVIKVFFVVERGKKQEHLLLLKRCKMALNVASSLINPCLNHLSLDPASFEAWVPMSGSSPESHFPSLSSSRWNIPASLLPRNHASPKPRSHATPKCQSPATPRFLTYVKTGFQSPAPQQSLQHQLNRKLSRSEVGYSLALEEPTVRGWPPPLWLEVPFAFLSPWVTDLLNLHPKNVCHEAFLPRHSGPLTSELGWRSGYLRTLAIRCSGFTWKRGSRWKQVDQLCSSTIKCIFNSTPDCVCGGLTQLLHSFPL